MQDLESGMQRRDHRRGRALAACIAASLLYPPLAEGAAEQGAQTPTSLRGVAALTPEFYVVASECSTTVAGLERTGHLTSRAAPHHRPDITRCVVDGKRVTCKLMREFEGRLIEEPAHGAREYSVDNPDDDAHGWVDKDNVIFLRDASGAYAFLAVDTASGVSVSTSIGGGDAHPEPVAARLTTTVCRGTTTRTVPAMRLAAAPGLAGGHYCEKGPRWRQAQDTVRRFYRCLLADEAKECREVLLDADSLAFGNPVGASSAAPAWRYLRSRRDLLLVTGLENEVGIEALRMRFDIPPDGLTSGNLSVVVPDHGPLKDCGVMKEVHVPLLWRDTLKGGYVVVASAISVNGVALAPWLDHAGADARERERKDALLKRALCPGKGE